MKAKEKEALIEKLEDILKYYPKTYSDKIYDAVTIYEGIGEVERVGVRRGLEIAIDIIKAEK